MAEKKSKKTKKAPVKKFKRSTFEIDDKGKPKVITPYIRNKNKSDKKKK